MNSSKLTHLYHTTRDAVSLHEGTPVNSSKLTHLYHTTRDAVSLHECTPVNSSKLTHLYHTTRDAVSLHECTPVNSSKLTHLYHTTRDAVSFHDDGKRFSAHLSEITVHDARTEERCTVHQFEELDVIIIVHGCIDRCCKANVCGFTHILA